MAGGHLGARLLLVSPQAPFTLLLTALILAYLQVKQLHRGSLSSIRGHPRISAAAFRIAAGFAYSSANIATPPPLLIHFLALEV